MSPRPSFSSAGARPWRWPPLAAALAIATLQAPLATAAAPQSENYVLSAAHAGGGGGLAIGDTFDGFGVVAEALTGEGASPLYQTTAGLLAATLTEPPAPAGIEVTVSNTPDSVALGSAASWDATVRNLGSDMEDFDSARIDVTGSVSTSIPLYSGPIIALPPGGSITQPVSVPVPLSAPLGNYAVATVVAYLGSDLDSAEFTTEVVP